ncbi:MAG: sulfite exporter TauE/SafE family protein [Cyclobacteriaceae bacterium]|nr:sulfite exporter TauE/SafE family protein [Cyclobacteriaceae bacterium]
MSWIAAILMGLTGGFHCAGMCSPLAAVIAVRPPATLHRLLYNAGRVLTYALLGAVAATAGSLLQFNLLQNWISLGMGTLLILLGIGTVGNIRIPLLTSGVQKLTLWIKRHFSTFLGKRTTASVFVLGMLNGLLPCGLTYIALTYCLTLFSPLDGFVFMLLFGVGTLPVMLGFTALLGWLTRRFSFSSAKLATISFILVGMLLIGRGVFTHMHSTDSPTSTATVCK